MRAHLAERQQAMAERQKTTRARQPRATESSPKPNRWIKKHFVEVMERLIDDLGLDVPRREHKQLTA